MGEKGDLYKLLEDSEDQLFQQIVNRMEGIEGLEESKRPGPEPSPEALAHFEAELDMLTARPRPQHRRLFRIAAIAAILLALLLIGVHAIRLLNWMDATHEKYTQTQLTDPPEAQVRGWSQAYLPGYVPEGFTVSDCFNGEDFKSIEYADVSGTRFTFYQYNASASIRIDTEAADKAMEQTISGHTAYQFQKGGLSTVYWSNGALIFYVQFDQGALPEPEIIQFANGLKWHE